jgi:O-antigen/teichoic acid export membrane protein
MSITPPSSGGSLSRRKWGGLIHFFSLSFGFIALRAVLNPVQIKVLTSLLSPEQYGTMTLIAITAWYLADISSIGHYDFLVRWLPGRSKAQQLGVLALVWRYFGSFVASLAVVIVAALLIFRPAKLALEPIQLVIAGTYSVALVFLFQRIFFLSARAEWIRVRTLQLMWSDTWFLPILMAAAFMSITLNTVLVGWLLWALVAAVFAHRWVGGDTDASARCSVRIGEVLRFGAPLLPMMLGLSLVFLGERYLLLSLRDVEAVAKYTLCLNIAFIVYAVGAAVLDLFVPEFNKEFNRASDRDVPEFVASERMQLLFTIMLRYSLLLALTGGLFLLLCGRQLLEIISQPEYSSAVQIVPFLAPVPLFYLLWNLFNRILLARSNTRVIGLATLAIGAVNVGLNVVLIPRFGEIGCALALTISLALLAFFTGAFVRVWRWIVWAQLKPGRLVMMAVANGAGIFLSQAMLGQHALICVFVASSWCLICIVALRLVHWNDWSVLELAPLSERRRNIGSPSS